MKHAPHTPSTYAFSKTQRWPMSSQSSGVVDTAYQRQPISCSPSYLTPHFPVRTRFQGSRGSPQTQLEESLKLHRNRADSMHPSHLAPHFPHTFSRNQGWSTNTQSTPSLTAWK